jgi:hypothetical protein
MTPPEKTAEIEPRRSAMTATIHNILGAALINVAIAGSALAADDRVSVTYQGFCLRLDEMRCEEVALPGTMVAFDRLTKREDGSRIIYFFSDHEVEGDPVLVHVLESEDLDEGLQIVPDETTKSQAAKLNPAMKKIAEKVHGSGMVQISPYRPAKSKAKNHRAFTTLKIVGPGYFSGRVVDLDGKLVSISERTSFSVIRRPQQ